MYVDYITINYINYYYNIFNFDLVTNDFLTTIIIINYYIFIFLTHGLS